MLAGMRDRGHAAVGVQLASLDRHPPLRRHARTLQYSSTHLRPPPSLAGWLMAVKSTILCEPSRVQMASSGLNMSPWP
jgi:hypothetical protein